ncbi:ATP-binding protein [Paenibacillus agaridevorans]|uniref:histidine kinase n=1 Tax=Paenibacillus agaridevorans TaxID=171404 RepID=A0A2R5EM58_9BACL|nr:ATP-binding protein [Paenibacillus agaridevorans]GBG07647.1 ATP-binding protein [Paenibacillus agaridevorans]
MARFRTKARAVDLLGKQQIRDEITAVSELLRNSYDADAMEGLIQVDSDNDYIMVWDDGEGMDEKDIIDSWLTIGTYSKKTKKIQPSKKKRIKIGEKGIGRLAISLLGDQLLLCTKKRGFKPWTLLYLHWDLFRNERLFLEDIELPLRTFDSLDQMKDYLTENIIDMKTELIKNLSDEDKWDSATADKIRAEVNSFQINDTALNRLYLNERRGGGTLFYINNLENDWDWKVYLTQVEDESRKERRLRLQNVLVSFQNLIDLFDRQENEDDNENKFLPMLHINGHKLENESWFNPDDIQLFDYALKGTIDNGQFTGQAVIKNMKSDETHEILHQKLTSGIHTSNMIDIGPIYIKWFFIEGKKDLTVLSPEQHNMMMSKLIDSGGIYVFRDGLRILPYGEQGNDFLKIEERRSKGAGYYLFSHRRMYGYMEISKLKNPKLTDKSSREGFVENSAFDYFRSLAINLLKWWATEFLETKLKESGKRTIRNQRLQNEREQVASAIKKQREEEKREKQYFDNLENVMSNFDASLEKTLTDIIKQINERIYTKKTEILSNTRNKSSSAEMVDKLSFELYRHAENIDNLRIHHNLRYFHSQEWTDKIDSAHITLANAKKNIHEHIEAEIASLKQKIEDIDEQINDSSDKKDYDTTELQAKFEYALQWIKEGLPSLIDKSADLEIKEFENIVQSFAQESLAAYRKRTLQKYHDELAPALNNFKFKLQDLENIMNKITSLDFFLDSEGIQSEALLAISDFDKHKEAVHQEILSISNDNRNSNVTADSIQTILRLKDRIIQGDTTFSDDAYIGLLKQEVNMYRELSAIGLAAELTSHEFNALYKSIRDQLGLLQKSLANTRILPVVEKTGAAFRSLERLHQRMNPLYRQVRARKQNINIKAFLESVLEYFESDLKRYSISPVIKVSDHFSIRETDSILFTPIVNLISNSIYWMLNSEQKQLHFYTDKEERHLYIHDSGPGVEGRDQNHIFEPYFTRKTEGRGLGLFLSKDILESRGHQLYLVNAENEVHPVGGACFCIEFSEESRKEGLV